MGKKEDIMASSTKSLANIGAATLSGDNKQILGTVISEVLSVTIDSFMILSKKRTNQLFDNESMLVKIIEQARESEDFSSLLVDIWSRHNYESSEIRRKFLKNILENAARESNRDYINFSRIISVAQQISLSELKLLSFIYTHHYNTSPPQPIFNLSSPHGINSTDMYEILKRAKYTIDESEFNTIFNQLGNFGVVTVAYGALGGNLYSPNKFGYTFLSYIHDSESATPS